MKTVYLNMMLTDDDGLILAIASSDNALEDISYKEYGYYGAGYMESFRPYDNEDIA